MSVVYKAKVGLDASLAMLDVCTKRWEAMPSRVQGEFISRRAIQLYLGNLVLGYTPPMLARAYGVSNSLVHRYIKKVDEVSEIDEGFGDMLVEMEKQLDGMRA